MLKHQVRKVLKKLHDRKDLGPSLLPSESGRKEVRGDGGYGRTVLWKGLRLPQGAAAYLLSLGEGGRDPPKDASVKKFSRSGGQKMVN